MSDTTVTSTAPISSSDDIIDQQPPSMDSGVVNGDAASVVTDRLSPDLDISPAATVVPSNTPVTADSGQGSPNMQSSSESLNEDALVVTPDSTTGEATAQQQVNESSATTQEVGQGEAAVSSQVRDREAKKLERKEEKKRSKKKEDKGIEFILRALSSLHTPEEKLAALCKKYADLNEEHRTLQTSFKTQQRTMTVVMHEKDQLQVEHTRAMMAKSKLESLCRELQKHNKIIKEESLKRAKEDDEKRKEISQQFNTTISEIQVQMSENTERNSKLRQENENMASQLKAFISSIELRDQQVDKLQKHHELEKKLFEAKMKQAEALLTESTEKGNKERELVMLKLAESHKKNTILEAQVSMFKDRYAEFEQLHSRSSETFQKYKTEMDKMTKRIKKLEKDGLAWKTKWEKTNGALIEQVEARSKSEKETLTYVQKTRKLESLCRALQAELHNKKVAESNPDGSTDTAPEAASAPPNSPEASSSGQCSPDSDSTAQPQSEAQPSSSSPVNGETTTETTTTLPALPSSKSASTSSTVPPSSSTSSQPEATTTTTTSENNGPAVPPSATTASENVSPNPAVAGPV